MDIIECASNPCQNGAICVDEVNQYSCSCATGYIGTNCETGVKKCSRDACDSTTENCVEGGDTYACHCKANTRRQNNKCVPTKSYEASMTITLINGMEAEYSNALDDRETAEFKLLARNIADMMDRILRDHGGYVDTVVIGFFPGSVNAQTVSAFLNTSSVTSDNIETSFENAVRGQNTSNLTVGNIKVKEFEESACILPGSHDCHKYASCIDKDDGSFTCECKSDYQDDSEEPSDRPGRLCSEISMDHLMTIAIGVGILSGLLLISTIVFIVHCCHVCRKAGKITEAPVMNDLPPAVHSLIHPGTGAVRRPGVDDGIYSDPETGKYFGNSAATSHLDEKRVDLLQRHLTNASTGKLQNDLPDRDYPNAEYYQSQARADLKSGNQERLKEPPLNSQDLDSKMAVSPLGSGDTFIRPYVATGDEANNMSLNGKLQKDLPDRDYPNAEYYQSQARAGLKSGNQEKRKGVPAHDHPDVGNPESMDAAVHLRELSFNIPRAAVRGFRPQTTGFGNP
ncbi:uncharacterized protein [Ptychodera flava]|uniref:uncharacterized protein n=1 Tax=Ptychodera flava TaxID=63121 RepID=UPI003969D4B3